VDDSGTDGHPRAASTHAMNAHTSWSTNAPIRGAHCCIRWCSASCDVLMLW